MEKILSGKVREVYDAGGGRLVIYTTDRVSAFDVILDKPVPGKGAALNAISNFWFDYTKGFAPNHIIAASIEDMPPEVPAFFGGGEYAGKIVYVKKLNMLPYEFIVRGYIFGNMYKAYKEGGVFCGIDVSQGGKRAYELAEKLDEPLFTPSSKAKEGHDVYISYEEMARGFIDLGYGEKLAAEVRDLSVSLYRRCYEHALSKGIIIADTKFEFGLDDGGALTLADEALTPDSSRFWAVDEYKTGASPKSYDKQFIRDWITENGSCSIPDDVINKTSAIYAECAERIIKG